jgi:hypothetical protein
MTTTDIFERGLEQRICTAQTAFGSTPQDAA